MLALVFTFAVLCNGINITDSAMNGWSLAIEDYSVGSSVFQVTWVHHVTSFSQAQNFANAMFCAMQEVGTVPAEADAFGGFIVYLQCNGNPCTSSTNRYSTFLEDTSFIYTGGKWTAQVIGNEYVNLTLPDVSTPAFITSQGEGSSANLTALGLDDYESKQYTCFVPIDSNVDDYSYYSYDEYKVLSDHPNYVEVVFDPTATSDNTDVGGKSLKANQMSLLAISFAGFCLMLI